MFGGVIEPPPRSSPLGAAIILLTVGLAGVYLLAPGRAEPWVVGGVALLGLGSLARRQAQAFHLAALVLAVGLIGLLGSPWSRWPMHFAAPLASYFLLAWCIPELRRSVLWVRAGRFSREVWVWLVMAVGVSVAALVIWYRASQPSLDELHDLVPEIEAWLIPIVGIGFIVLNAALEEGIFRGILLQALDSAVGPGRVALALQAALFGALHLSEGAIPHGYLGVAMTFVYGLVLGTIRYRAQGMLAPWIAHALADAAVFCVVMAGVYGS